MNRSLCILSSFLLISAVLIGLCIYHSIQMSTTIRVLKLPHTMPSDHPVHLALVQMAEEVKKESKGSLQIQIYENGLLGDGSQIKELMQLNVVDIGKFSACDFEDNIPEMAVFCLPYLFRDEKHYWQVLESPLGKKILSAGDNNVASVYGLCYYDAGARSFYTTSPVNTLENLKNKKIRVMVSALMVSAVEALGATPTSMAWGELFTALQNKTVDGAENNIPSFFTSKHYEICKYFIYSEHFRTPDILAINSKCWKSLSSEHQQILQKAAEHSSIYQRQLWNELSTNYIKKMTESGVSFKTIDQQAAQEKIKPFYEAIRHKAQTDSRSKIIIDLADTIKNIGL